jgi:YVTN family beta-propeller protein
VALLMAGFGLEAATRSAAFGWRGLALYVAALAAMVLGAAVCVLLPRTRPVIGPGLLLGSAAASVWGLVYLTGQAVRARTDVAYWLEFAGHVTILAAAGLAGAALWKDPAVRLELSWPRSARAWVAAALAGIAVLVGVLTMMGFLHTVTHLGRVYSGSVAGAAFADRARASLATAVLTVAVPVWAAVLAPRPLRVAVLGGWVGGGLAVCAGSLWWTGTMTLRDSGGSLWYAGSLLVLAGAAALAARGAATSPVTVRRSALLAGLTAVPVLAAGAGAVVYQLAAAPITEVAPYGLAISPDGNRLYVVAQVWTRNTDHPEKPETRPGKVWVIDATTRHRIGEPVPVGRGAADVAVSRDGGYVYVANQTDNTVSVISAREKTTVGEPLRVGEQPGMVRITGTRLLVINGGSHDVAAVDTGTNRLTGTRIPLGDSAGAIAITNDGGRVYVASGTSGEIQAVDTGTGKAAGTRMVLGQRVETMAVSPDGGRLYATSTVNDGTGIRARLTTFDTATGLVTGDAIPLASGPQFGIAVSPDGSRVYVTNFFDRSVSVIDAKTGAAVGRPVQVGGAPGAVAVSPDGQRVYVTLPSNGRVAAFRTDAPGNLTLIDIKVG